MASFKIADSGDADIHVTNLEASQMHQVGEAMIQTMKARMLQGHNLQDSPSKPLSKRHAKIKAKIGADPIRNMRLAGHTLADMAVLKQAENSVTVGFQSHDAMLRALFNQSRDPMFGLSPHDQGLVRSDVLDQVLHNLHP